MKPLYYLEIARSMNFDNTPIPATSLKWKTRKPKIAWEDAELCDRDRIDDQKHMIFHIIRVRQAGWLKNIWIRFVAWMCDDWIVIKG